VGKSQKIFSIWPPPQKAQTKSQTLKVSHLGQNKEKDKNTLFSISRENNLIKEATT
jgi:hypothetical protein